MPGRSGWMAMAGAATLATLAGAQTPIVPPPSATAGPDVVVTARKADPATVRRETRLITRTVRDQVPRFADPVCPAAIGLSAPADRIVEQRIRAVAALARIKVGLSGCTPNLLVMIADDPPATLAALHRRHEGLFDALELHDFQRLLQSPGPAWSWQSTEPKRRDGGPIERISQITIAGQTLPVSKGAYIVSNVDLSRLTVAVRQDITSAFVVIDLHAADGLTLTQLGVYAAVLGLAPVDPAKAGRVSSASILTLFADRSDGRSPEPGATGFDIGYLAGLYAGEAGVSASQKVGDIAVHLARPAAGLPPP